MCTETSSATAHPEVRLAEEASAHMIGPFVMLSTWHDPAAVFFNAQLAIEFAPKFLVFDEFRGSSIEMSLSGVRN